MAFGVTPEGFVQKTLADIRATINAGLKTVYGVGVNVDGRSRIGQFIGIFGESLSDVWELGETIAGALDPRSATGLFLDNVLALTGMARLAAAYSTVDLIVVGTATTALAAGDRASVTGTTNTFEFTTGGTIDAVPDWAIGAATNVGDFVRNGGKVYIATTGGTTLGSGGGPSGTGTAIADNDVVWRHLGTGDAASVLAAEATVTGPLQGFAFSITTIDTVVSGWNAVVNMLDAVPGRNLETDAEARVRREQFIAAISSSTFPGVVKALGGVTGVTRVSLFENTTDATVGNLTPHSIEAMVEGGADAAIRTAVHNSKPAGIETIGNVTGTVADAEGYTHTRRFSRPEDVDLYVKLTVEKTAAFPTDGIAQVKAAIVAFGDAQRCGHASVPDEISANLFQAVPGIFNVPVLEVGFTSSTADAVLPLTPRQKADYDTSRIALTVINQTAA